MEEKIIIQCETTDGYYLTVIGDSYKTLDEFLEENELECEIDDEGFYNSKNGEGRYKFIKGNFVELVKKEVVTKFELK